MEITTVPSPAPPCRGKFSRALEELCISVAVWGLCCVICWICLHAWRSGGYDKSTVRSSAHTAFRKWALWHRCGFIFPFCIFVNSSIIQALFPRRSHSISTNLPIYPSEKLRTAEGICFRMSIYIYKNNEVDQNNKYLDFILFSFKFRSNHIYKSWLSVLICISHTVPSLFFSGTSTLISTCMLQENGCIRREGAY